MPAFVIMIRNKTLDPERMKRYAELAPKAPIDKLEVIAAKTGRFEVLEGEKAEAAVILRFPTWEDAEQWYHSPEYQEAKQHRLGGVDNRVIMVEGV